MHRLASLVLRLLSLSRLQDTGLSFLSPFHFSLSRSPRSRMSDPLPRVDENVFMRIHTNA